MTSVQSEQHAQSQSYATSNSGAVRNITYGHVFHDITVSGHAHAIFGDVHVSCPDFMEHMTPIQKRRALLNALFYEDMHRRLAYIEAARPETCDWIWATEFAHWLAEPVSSNLFWISGKPGSGKSTLMKYLTSNPETRSRLPPTNSKDKIWAISHFFFDFRASRNMPNTEQGLLRSLLYQIVTELPVERNVLTKYELTLENILNSRQVDEMIGMLAEVVSQENLSVMFFVDGLDEYEHNLHGLIQLLQKIRVQTGVRLCLASRPEPIIEAMLGFFPQVKVQEHNSTGIAAYVRKTVDELRLNINVTNLAPIEPFIAYILDKAGGVFLWVHFAVNTFLEHLVLGCTELEILQELEMLPTQVDGMYDRIFDQIPLVCRSEAAMVLLLVKSSSHVISVDLLHSTWLYLHTVMHSGPANHQNFTREQFQLRIKGFLGGLLDFEETDDFGHTFTAGATRGKIVRVRLLHETLRAYIRDHAPVEQWMNTALSTSYPDNVWLRIYVEVLVKSDACLGTSSWDIVSSNEGIYKVDRLRNTQPWRTARVDLHSQLDAHRRQQLNLQVRSDLSHIDVLPHAILHIYTVAKAANFSSDTESLKLTMALQSPLLLLYNTIQAQPRQFGVPSKGRDRQWTYDLIFASSRSWVAYLEHHHSRLQSTSITERNYLISCCCARNSSFSLTTAQFNNTNEIIPLDREAASVLRLLLEDHVIDNSHVALLMQDIFHDQVSIFLPTLQTAYLAWQTSTSSRSLMINTHAWSGLYPLQTFNNAHLFDAWPHHSQDTATFHQWVQFLHSVGSDFHSWCNAAGQNLLGSVVDNALFWVIDDARNLRVVEHALELVDLGLKLTDDENQRRRVSLHMTRLHKYTGKRCRFASSAERRSKSKFTHALATEKTRQLYRKLRVLHEKLKPQLPPLKADRQSRHQASVEQCASYESQIIEMERTFTRRMWSDNAQTFISSQPSDATKLDQLYRKARELKHGLTNDMDSKPRFSTQAPQVSEPNTSSRDSTLSPGPVDTAFPLDVGQLIQNTDQWERELTNSDEAVVETSKAIPETSNSDAISIKFNAPEIKASSIETSPSLAPGVEMVLDNTSADDSTLPLRPRRSRIWGALRNLRPKSIG